jgi:4-aminobutyrate aminotransferase / (S)-3-amino-2-methylpropionate transaminase / 5-aminovalerate transaminase
MIKIDTKYRRIITDIPVPESLAVRQKLSMNEVHSTHGQPPVIWDKAEGFQVFDPYGNKFIDFTSGVLVANVGHSHPKIVNAIKEQLDQKILFSYCFPTQIKSDLISKINEITPKELNKYYLLSTGSEAVETLIKLARTWGINKVGNNKNKIISFTNAFHGRTLGSQQAGGISKLKEWIVNIDNDFVQVPFPDGIYEDNLSFEKFTSVLAEKGVNPKDVAGVIMEPYQGGVVSFAPVSYVKQLRDWCFQNEVLLMFDEVQSGCGRTGKMWAFEHYDVIPDLFSVGKGISGSLPLSVVVGKEEIMQQYGHGQMTTTHGGNTLCCAAAKANIEILQEEGLITNSKKIGSKMLDYLKSLEKFTHVKRVCGKGLVAGIHIVDRDGIPDGEKAHQYVRNIVSKGVLLFEPVGPGAATIKLCPPLCINKEALMEALAVITETIGDLQVG